MMRQSERFLYAHGAGCRALEMMYVDGMSSMIILLPDGDLDEFEENLDLDTFQRIHGLMTNQLVDLTMPKFEFTSSLSLKETLEEMGMPIPFDPASADFSGFTGFPQLFISAVVHKAFVKVDETGTEAAAATAVVMSIECAMPDQPIELVLDRPFLFLVRDGLTGSILFMGRVADPTAA
jgi:serpin B